MPSAPRPITIIGAGSIISGAHLPAYRKWGLPVAGIYDRDIPRAKAVAEEFGVPARFARPGGVLLPLAEIAIALAMLFPQTARWGGPAAAVLLGSFVGAIGNVGAGLWGGVLLGFAAGHVLAASYVPETAPTCGPGTARFYAFELSNAVGFFDDNSVAETADRNMSMGSGVPSNPRVSVSSDPQDDVVFVTTSKGEVIVIEPPLRDPPESSFLYWRRRF